MSIVANFLTSLNLISGVIAIIFALMGRLDLAPLVICFGAIFDFFDGFFARMSKQNSELGKQLDSLSDIVTFGVAPGIIMLVVLAIDVSEIDSKTTTIEVSNQIQLWFNNLFLGDPNLIPFAGLIIPFFTLFRLAKFNITDNQTQYFIGLPAPMNTFFFMLFPLIISFEIKNFILSQILAPLFNPYFLSFLMISMGFLMVSKMRLLAFKFTSLRIKGNEIRVSFLLISLLFIFLFKVWSIALIVFLYIILSTIENIIFKKNKDEI